MFSWFKGPSESLQTARALYAAVVEQARHPAFYTAFGVADTTEGRYEMVALHLVTLIDRLGQPDVNDEELRREILETFITDMDDAMREMGVGDTTVPKKVKRAAAGVYARGVSYREALAATGDEPLIAVLTENVYAGGTAPQAAALAAYTRRMARELAPQDEKALRGATVKFPNPGDI